MALTQEKVAKNARRYYSTIEKYGFFNDALVKILGEDFIKAPASTREDLHNAFEGGLVDHLLKVAKYAVLINKILPENLQVAETSLLRVSLLHQIGKAKLYVKKDSDWHKKQGIYYDFNNALVSMRVGERSVRYIMLAGIELTDEEYQVILNHDKDDDDKQAKWHTSTIGTILKQANELAIIEEKSESNVGGN